MFFCVRPDALRGCPGANIGVVSELHTFGFHLIDSALNDGLIQLEVRNTEAKQSAGFAVLLKNCHGVAFSGKLLCTSQAGRTAADNGNGLAVKLSRYLRFDPTLVPSVSNNCTLHRLYAHRLAGVVKNTAVFAKSRTDTRGKFRKTIR